MDILWYVIEIIFKILIIVIPLMGTVAYLLLAERKVIAFMQLRLGPNRVGIRGLAQPLADVIKLLCKELIIPSGSNRYLFLIAPILTLAPALAAWSVIPFNQNWVLADVNAGVLYILAMTSLGVYGILIAGWASNSKYAFYGAMRSAAQMIAYEIAMGFALAGVLLAAGSMQLQKIVLAQAGGLLHWYVLPLFPLFFVYWVAAVAETNRAPFDVAEGESEIVAGFHVEYSGIMFGLFFLGEYVNMILVSVLSALLFFGGWLPPFHALAWVPGLVWLLLKSSFFLFLYFWIRATFPRYRYDQIMRLGWKVLIPLSLVWLVVVAVMVQTHCGIWF